MRYQSACYGFEINQKKVVKTIQDPARVDQKGTL